MKAPDKIFITEDFAKFAHLDLPVPQRECIEYIRKDALLEWAEEEIEKTSIGLSEYDAGHENARMELLNDFTDKLKSM